MFIFTLSKIGDDCWIVYDPLHGISIWQVLAVTALSVVNSSRMIHPGQKIGVLSLGFCLFASANKLSTRDGYVCDEGVDSAVLKVICDEELNSFKIDRIL